MNWWHDNLTGLAAQLSKGVLTEMKRRIQTSNIQREKLQLDKDSQSMRSFFDREIKRFSKRKEATRFKQADLKDIMRQLVECNIALARKFAAFAAFVLSGLLLAAAPPPPPPLPPPPLPPPPPPPAAAAAIAAAAAGTEEPTAVLST